MVEDHADTGAGDAFDGEGACGSATLGHAGIDAVDELPECRVEPIARMRQVDLDLGGDTAGIGGEHQDAVAHQHRLFDIVRHHQHRLDRQPALDPEIDQVGAQRLGGQHVERRKRLVHQQQVGMHHQRAGEADALAHAARQFLRDKRTRSRRGRSGRSPQAPGCGARRYRCQALPDPARRSAARSATETARTTGTPWRRRSAGP